MKRMLWMGWIAGVVGWNAAAGVAVGISLQFPLPVCVAPAPVVVAAPVVAAPPVYVGTPCAIPAPVVVAPPVCVTPVPVVYRPAWGPPRGYWYGPRYHHHPRPMGPPHRGGRW